MMVVYMIYVAVYIALWTRRIKPARVRLFLPLFFMLPTALQFIFLIGRSSVEFAYSPESSGRKTGYLVLDMFWLLILGPAVTLTTLLSPLHYMRYVVLVRILRQQLQRSFDDHDRSMIETPQNDSRMNALARKATTYAEMNTLSVRQERLVLWLRRLSSDQAFIALYLVLQLLLSTFYIIMLVLDYGLSVLPERSSYLVGTYIQNIFGIIAILLITSVFIIECLIHIVQHRTAIAARPSSIVQLLSSFLLDSPFYFHIDAMFLAAMVPVVILLVIDRFTRFLPHPLLDVTDMVFQTLWLLSLGSAGAMITYGITRMRMKRRKEGMESPEENDGTEIFFDPSNIPENIMKCITDSRLRDKFERHATREQCVENVWCIYALQTWEKLQSGEQRQDFFQNMVYNKFVAKNAIYEVNIGNEMRNLIETGEAEGVAALRRTAIENLRGVFMRFDYSAGELKSPRRKRK